MMRSLFLFITVLVWGCQPQKHETSIPPNIIFILADDLGYNDISTYRRLNQNPAEKPPTCQTPNIDQLAREGLQFSNFYCGAAVCSPSRAALITGRNAARVGIYNWIPENSPMHLRNEEVTIAEMLKQKDYQTGHFGKWHLTSEGTEQPLPQNQGFDYAFYTFNNAQPSHHNPVNFHRNGERVGELEGYSCQLVVDEAITWLTDHQEKPFYMNIWFNEPHEKVAAPDSLSQKHAYKQQYYGAIENLDLAVGKLMNYLKANNLDKNTIIIFSSDNGSQVWGSNAPFRGEKCFNFEGGLRVPFIVKGTGIPKANMPVGTVGSFVDILPTIAKITQTNLPENKVFDGEDLSEVFYRPQKAFKREKPVFFYRYFHEPVSMLREENWVLLGFEEKIPYQPHYNPKTFAKLKPEPGAPAWSMWGFQELHMDYLNNQKTQYFELYDMEADAEQKQDVSNKHPEIVEKMKTKMIHLQEEMIAEGGNWFN
ncbi:sulfatase-like hydrolase/transferase [Flexithrix dorotheae]|uniref:sulfatase-like hydrolase/transferase n=1 Tax=Flexithrix dorotheae TaxID=70993 RepID=UPI00039EF96D|nr:sulfatase-like hydrolase/transferase [Flexithrix dorotheae]